MNTGNFVKRMGTAVCMQNMSGNLLPAPSSARDFPRKPPPPTGGFAQDGGLSGDADNLCLRTNGGTANTVKKSWQVSTQIRVDSLHNEICQASF